MHPFKLLKPQGNLAYLWKGTKTETSMIQWYMNIEQHDVVTADWQQVRSRWFDRRVEAAGRCSQSSHQPVSSARLTRTEGLVVRRTCVCSSSYPRQYAMSYHSLVYVLSCCSEHHHDVKAHNVTMLFLSLLLVICEVWEKHTIMIDAQQWH